jgi:hypothetical protein
MFRITLTLALALSFGQALASPRFADFPAQYSGAKKAALKLVDAKSRRYASMLRTAAKSDPNFAGHYIVASWGCGASCMMAAAIDATTGLVAWLPFTVCCWRIPITEPLEFYADSRLLVVHGSRDEQGDGDETRYYEFQNNTFKPLVEK